MARDLYRFFKIMFLSQPLKPCRPPFWARGGHAQTILGHLLPSAPLRATGQELVIGLPDGDRLVARYFEGHARSRRLVVYVFHGLGGSSEAAYMTRTARVALELGHSVILANHRGAGPGAGLARNPYHSGRAEDLSEVLRLGRQMHPRRRHLAIGFSLSANALLLLLAGGRAGADVRPDCAIAVNGPIDLAKTARALHHGFNRVYDLRFVGDSRRAIVDRGRYKVPRLSTLYDFDAAYTAPASGFASRDEYYRTCSTKMLLGAITTPTVLLTAKDDPFIDYRDYVDAPRPANVHLHLEEHGGHMGYLTRTRTPLGTRRWLDYALAAYIEAFAT